MDRQGKYAGAEWIENILKSQKKPSEMSPLGIAVANLLGDLFGGIYHLDDDDLLKVNWSNNHHIEIKIGWRDWSTTDSDNLTRLVFLAHHLAIRVSITPIKYQRLLVMFHQRTRGGDSMEKHPTLREAVEKFERNISLREMNEQNANI